MLGSMVSLIMTPSILIHHCNRTKASNPNIQDHELIMRELRADHIHRFLPPNMTLWSRRIRLFSNSMQHIRQRRSFQVFCLSSTTVLRFRPWTSSDRRSNPPEWEHSRAATTAAGRLPWPLQIVLQQSGRWSPSDVDCRSWDLTLSSPSCCPSWNLSVG